jgi:nucleoside-diphosphate-sugar epimerase
MTRVVQYAALPDPDLNYEPLRSVEMRRSNLIRAKDSENGTIRYQLLSTLEPATVHELALALEGKVSRRAIYDFLSGKRDTTTKVVEMIAEAMNCSIELRRNGWYRAERIGEMLRKKQKRQRSWPA